MEERGTARIGRIGAAVGRVDGSAPPAAARVRAAVLAAAAMPGGCPVAGVEAAVAAHLGLAPGPRLRRRVERALGLLVVTGWVDEAGGRLVAAAGARRAV